MKYLILYIIPGLLILPSLILHFSTIEPFHRGYLCDDNTIKYPYVENQTVPTYLCLVIWIISCLLVFTITFTLHKSWEILRVALYKLVFGFCLCILITDVCKFLLGRLRPYFITICKPEFINVCYNDEEINNETYYLQGNTSLAWIKQNQKYVVGDTCTSDKDLIREARLSFVSGHSSTSFYIAIFLNIFMKTYVDRRILRTVLQVGNFILALWISITRVNDYMHHPEDVLMGAILGIICAFITLFNTNKQSLYHTKTNIIKCRVKPLKNVEQSLNV